jgi:hypothetical protein
MDLADGLCGQWLRGYFGAGSDLVVQPLRGNRWLTDGIWKVTNESRSVIVKTVSFASDQCAGSWARHWTAQSGEPTHWNYWKREFLAYLYDLPATFDSSGINSPALLYAYEGRGTFTFVTEHCGLTPATQWTAHDYYAAARNLGIAQGSISTKGNFGEYPWLCKNYIADYALEKPFDRSLPGSSEAWSGLIDVGAVSPRERDTQIRLARNERELMKLLAAVPLTLCHNDFWTRNLFGKDGQPTTVVDWAFVGIGPLGSDIANMTASAGFDSYIAPAHLASFADHVFDSYLNGLRQSGWKGDSRTVRLGYCASVAKYAWVVAAMLESAADPGHPTYVGYGGAGGLDFHSVAGTLSVLASMGDDAFALAGLPVVEG